MKKILFEEVCRIWEAEKSKEVKASSLAAYSLIVERQLLPRFKTLEDITPESVQGMIEEDARRGLKTNTIKSVILVIKMIIKFCERRGWLERRDYILRVPRHGAWSDPQTLSTEEEKAFVNWLKDHPTRLNLGLLICAFCGLRIGEVCALRWEDIDLGRKVMQVKRTVYRIYDPRGKPKKSKLVIGTPKTGTSWREIPIADFLAEMIRNIHKKGKDKNDDYVLSGDASPTDPQNVRNNFSRVLNTLGFPARKVHSLRHTFATRCLESKCDYKTLSTLLGHSNVTTTLNIYAHPDINQKRKCIEDMIKII